MVINEKSSPHSYKKALLAIILIMLPISIVFIHDYNADKEYLRVDETKQTRALAEGYEAIVCGFLDDGLDFIAKPVSLSDFLKKIREVLDR